MNKLNNNDSLEKANVSSLTLARIAKKSIKELFIGSFTHSVDSKGRVIIPSQFRNVLGEEFAIAPTTDLSSIAIHTESSYMHIYEDLQSLDDSDPDIYEYKEIFFQLSSTNQQADSQGRILIPAQIRKMLLNNSKEIKFIGMGEYISIKPLDESEERLESYIKNRKHNYDLFRKAKAEQENKREVNNG